MSRFPGNSIIVRYDVIAIDDMAYGYIDMGVVGVTPPTAEYVEKYGTSMNTYLVTIIKEGYVFGRPILDRGVLGVKTAIFSVTDRLGYAIVLRGTKFISRYPHVCPLCKGNAYIGLVNVDHEDASTACP